ncbi:MAG TPA: TRAP transporter large permease subunit [Anaeromyxobacter sp.]|nr:TRAP transporter large permease subunit [Anaeromyxobacter sp.]
MKIKKELLFGLVLMAAVVIATLWAMPPFGQWKNGHYGLFMLSMIVVAIMLGFPTAFTLMGMGVIFTYIAYRSGAPSGIALRQTLDLMTQRAYSVMTNDVLISVPLFVFMGYLVERAALIQRLFKSLHLAIGRIPGSLAVATLATCAVFATATGIIGAVVTLMGLLAFPAMLRSKYDIKLSAGVITAGGTLGILIPPSVLLILYGATASVSVVQLYAGAFFPGLMLAGLYIVYVIVRAKLNPALAPKPPPEETRVDVPEWALRLSGGDPHRLALPVLVRALASGAAGMARAKLALRFAMALVPLVLVVAPVAVVYGVVTSVEVVDTGGLVEVGSEQPTEEQDFAGGVEEPPDSAEQQAVPAVAKAPAAADAKGLEKPAAEEKPAEAAPARGEPPAASDRKPAPLWFWGVLAVAAVLLVVVYAALTFERLEILKLLLSSFFPLSALILAVLGSIIFGWATPTEAAAMGAAGGVVLAAAYGKLNLALVKESAFLTAKTSAMVCWLFVGSSIFSAAFALLGGQEIIEHWVLSLHMTPVQFLLLTQVVIFLLGWPLEWTEIIVIFMPIFLPLVGIFQNDPNLQSSMGIEGKDLPLFFGLLVALNLQTAFLSPPVAMAAFYLKGVAPKHVSLNQIFAGMMPFMAIQVLALVILYVFPEIGLWLPHLVYK